jgi:galactose mutarotase-like enzyme
MELLAIENKYLKLLVNRVGAEITQLISKKNNQEFIWKGGNDIWANHAPVLFPIVGGLKDDKYSFDGKTYELSRHGFARYNNDFTVSNNESILTFTLKSSEKTLKVYPFDFSFKVSFSLNENEVTVSHEVANKSDKNMLFSVGGHPAFCFEESINDYQIQFSSQESGEIIDLNDSGMRTDVLSKLQLEQEKSINLNDSSFNKDAWIFDSLASKKITLKGKSGSVVEMNKGDFNHFGIWSKPGAPFVCLEPWLGLADHENHDGKLENKSHLLSLPKGETFKASFSFKIISA